MEVEFMALKKKKVKDRTKEDTKEVEKAKKRIDERREMRLKDEEKRAKASTKGDPTLQGTTGEGGTFRVLGSFHKEGPLEPNPGMVHEVNEEFDSPLPLDELFANKFLRLSGGKTRLGRDEDRKQIDSEVRDRPLPQRIEEAEEDDAEAGADEEDEEADEAPSAKKAKTADRRKAPEPMEDEEGKAAAMEEEDEEGPTKFSERKKKVNRAARKHRD